MAKAKILVRGEVPSRPIGPDHVIGSHEHYWSAQIRDLSKKVVSAREDERRRISRDIHDHLGQQITALRMNLEELLSSPRQHPWVVDRTRRVSRLAEELDKSMDLLVSQLRPPTLDQSGLPRALQDLVGTWSACFAITAQFHTKGFGELVHLPPEVEINLYRVTQEALHNVHKHASASHVTVLLERRGADVLLIVEDNGRGFTPRKLGSHPQRHGLGLVSMQERVATIGGRLEMDTEVGGGTSVYIRVPIQTAVFP